MTKLTKKRFKKACKGTGAILTVIAKKLEVERSTVYSFIKKNPEYCKEILEHEEEQILDMAESQLFMNVKNNERWSINYILSTKGKKRGYTQRQEIEHTGIEHTPVEIKIIMPKEDEEDTIRDNTNKKAK